MNTRRVIIAAISVCIIAFSFIRPINPDEPYYTACSHLILQGQKPYVNFIFHQMPLLIYVYSIVSYLSYWSLIAGRMLSIFLFLMSVAAVRKCMVDMKLDKNTINLFLLFYMVNAFLIDWAVTIRVYSLSIFLITWALVYFQRYVNSFKNSYLLICGILFTFLFFTKIVFIINLFLFITFAVYILFKGKIEKKGKAVLFLIVSIGFPLAIFFILFGADLETLYFNLLGANYLIKANYLSSFGITFSKFVLFFIIPQNILLVLIILLSGSKYSLIEVFILLNIVLYFIIHFFAQMLPEYMCVTTPLIIILSALRFERAKENLQKSLVFFRKFRLNRVILIFYLIFLPLSEVNFRNLIQSRKEIMLNPLEMFYFQDKLHQVPGTSVLSSWEGYSVYSNKQPYLAFNYLGDYVIPYSDKKILQKYEVVGHEGYLKLILDKETDIIVYDANNPSHLENMLNYINENYVLNFKYKDISVFIKK